MQHLNCWKGIGMFRLLVIWRASGAAQTCLIFASTNHGTLIYCCFIWCPCAYRGSNFFLLEPLFVGRMVRYVSLSLRRSLRFATLWRVLLGFYVGLRHTMYVYLLGYVVQGHFARLQLSSSRTGGWSYDWVYWCSGTDNVSRRAVLHAIFLFKFQWCLDVASRLQLFFSGQHFW